MASEVSLYLPGDDSLLEAASAAYAKISVTAGLSGAFKYANEKEAVKLAAAAAAKGETAVIIADDGRFNTVKLLLMKVLLTKVGHSDVISEKLSSVSFQDSREFRIHTAVPHGGKIFPSPDGLYSALSVKLRKGFVILASLDAKRLDSALSQGILKDLPGNQKSGKDMLRSCLDEAENAGKSIALADYGLAQAVMNVAESVGAKEGLILKTEASCDAPADDPQYIALLAKNAIENAGTDSIGAAISEPAADGSISICVADSESAKVEVIHALEGEDKSKTAKAATVKLFEMIADCTRNGIGAPEYKPKKGSVKPLIIVIICLVVAAIACLAIGLSIYKNSISKADVAGESTTVENVTSIKVSSTFGQTTRGADEELYDEVVPDFGEKESSLLEVIDTTYNAGGVKTQAANGQFTTNGAGAVEVITSARDASSDAARIATTVRAVISALMPTDEGGEEGGDTSTGYSHSRRTTTTTTARTTEKTTASAPQGKFVFTVYGYGHGVGMSQRGAIIYAEKGWTCNQILTHYYQGTTLMVDKNTPAEVTRRGVRMTLVAFLCRTVEPEIGPNSPMEALKAQAIAAYTFGMSNGWDRNQSFDPYFNYKGTKVEQAVFSILHITSEDEQPHAIFVSYNGGYANTVYCASMAGKTTSCKSVWSLDIPYLRGGSVSPESVDVSTVEFTVDQMRSIVRNFSGNTEILNQDPSTWIRIISHDGSYSNAIGYVDQMSIGGKTCTGSYFRTNLINYALRSHCFTIKYVKYN
jgi:SpoIID/LytB domain protein